MEPVRPIAPEFDAFGFQSKTRPARRARHRLAVEARPHLIVALFEKFAALQWARLIGSPGADLGIAAAAGEILVRLASSTGSTGPSPALAPQRFPVDGRAPCGLP